MHKEMGIVLMSLFSTNGATDIVLMDVLFIYYLIIYFFRSSYLFYLSYFNRNGLSGVELTTPDKLDKRPYVSPIIDKLHQRSI